MKNTKFTLNTRFRVLAVLHILACILFIYIVGCSNKKSKNEEANLKEAQYPLMAKSAASNDARVYATRETPSWSAQEVNGRPQVMKLQVDHDTDVFMVVENMPQFPGGEQARVDFILKNIKYPLIARETGAAGTVYISYIVEADGRITNAQVQKGFNSSCEAEALRVVNSMPRWKPGTHNGKPVRVKFTLPVRFALK